MHLSGVDGALWITGIVGEVLLLAILFFRVSYKIFPVFSAYLIWLIVSDPLLMLVLHLNNNLASDAYYRTYFICSVVQYALELAVLVEIAIVVLRPASHVVSRNFLFVPAVIMAVVAVGAFLFTAHLNSATLAHPRTYFLFIATVAILRLAAFLLIAGFSQLLGLTWKNHVLQLTSGLAFYAVVTLIVELAHSQLRNGPNYAQQYFAWDHLRIGGYLCTLYFWCYAFAKKEAPRKEFSPQMTKILVSLSGSTKRQRAVLARTRDQ
jgi:hypothetical protein